MGKWQLELKKQSVTSGRSLPFTKHYFLVTLSVTPFPCGNNNIRPYAYIVTTINLHNYMNFACHFVLFIVAVRFIGGENTQKTTDLPQVTDKLYHIMLYRVHHPWAGIKLTLVVIGTDCIANYKSIWSRYNYNHNHSLTLFQWIWRNTREVTTCL
jgi:hypothetical protein